MPSFFSASARARSSAPIEAESRASPRSRSSRSLSSARLDASATCSTWAATCWVRSTTRSSWLVTP
ncbi:hypothetical protein Mx4_p74 [Myxococcus phage Mx4]|nr:hypothetical protein Mx4_p74 [Myxococcus phage Mx4]